MSSNEWNLEAASCLCGSVTCEVEGTPIMTVACYCHSCQDAAHRFTSLPGAPRVTDEDGATHYVMVRKDRVRLTRGLEKMRDHRLSTTASTRRYIATCCGSPMFLEFKGGHWLSLYRDRFPMSVRPPVEMRTMTRDRRAGVTFKDGIPSPNTHSIGFMWRLMRAWIAMGFKTPKANYARGSIEA